MRAAQWIAVVLLAVIAGLQGYGMVRRPVEPVPQVVVDEERPTMAETTEMWRLRKDRALNQLSPNDAEMLQLMERRDAERRIKALGGSY
jgi:hypothetical protein